MTLFRRKQLAAIVDCHTESNYRNLRLQSPDRCMNQDIEYHCEETAQIISKYQRRVISAIIRELEEKRIKIIQPGKDQSKCELISGQRKNATSKAKKRPNN